MADFLPNLWSSIFTPGTTPTLLIATNVSFGLLQLLLLALLIATYSIHFLILSVLCGGLWYAINWFAVELGKVQEEERRKAAITAAAQEKREEGGSRRTGAREGDADDEGEDTEVEKSGGHVGIGGSGSVARAQDNVAPAPTDIGSKSSAGATTTGVQARGEVDRGTRRRGVEDMDRSGEISTDSEWEKVSNDES